MNDLGNILKNARLSKKLTIKQVSDDTAIRSYIIENFENGNFTFMPEVYIKSFVNTLTKYYKINIDTNLENKKFANEHIELKTEEKEKYPKSNLKPEISQLKEQFKKREVKKVSKISFNNYLIFVLLIILVIAGIIITIISLQSDRENLSVVNNKDINDDTLKIEVEKKNILSYFKESDSLNLRVVAKDTAWIRVIADNKRFFEQMLKKGEIKEWNAYEFFIVDIGNAGAVTLYRNNEELPSFGKPGTVAKNIRITYDNVTNIQSLNINYDSLNPEFRAKRKKKEKEQTDTKKVFILESPLEKKEDLFNKRNN